MFEKKEREISLVLSFMLGEELIQSREGGGTQSGLNYRVMQNNAI